MGSMHEEVDFLGALDSLTVVNVSQYLDFQHIPWFGASFSSPLRSFMVSLAQAGKQKFQSFFYFMA